MRCTISDTLETCVPRPRCTPAHRIQMNTPLLMEAQDARAAAPPPTQSAQYLFSGKSSNRFSSTSCVLFISIVTPLVSPAFLQHQVPCVILAVRQQAEALPAMMCHGAPPEGDFWHLRYGAVPAADAPPARAAKELLEPSKSPSDSCTHPSIFRNLQLSLLEQLYR